MDMYKLYKCKSKCRKYANYGNYSTPADVKGFGSKQVAGFSDKWSVKNIYDLAGNVWELTSEAYMSSYRVDRGGGYNDDGGGRSVSYRRVPSNINDSVGFRCRLYIK